MKRRALFLFILISVLSLTACKLTSTNPPPEGVSVPRSADDQGFNLLVVAKGEVELKRHGWPEYHTTAFGAMLRRGDQIRLSDDAEAVILCDNLEPWDAPTGTPSGLNGCPQPNESLLARNGSLIHNTRAASDPFIPYIISPRMTRLLTDQPRLRWNEVVGASNYIVKLQGVKWEAELNGTEIVYPGNPPLERGESYLLTIEADNETKSTDEEPTRLGFVLLSTEDAEIVQSHTTTINGLNLPDKSKALALAHLYAGQNLFAEAIDLLENMSHSEQTAATYRLLGDLYLEIGLPLQAESHYTEAITLSEAANDIEGRAAAQAGLGEVYSALNNKDDARHWLEEAQRGYDTLGDTTGLEDVATSLKELEE